MFKFLLFLILALVPLKGTMSKCETRCKTDANCGQLCTGYTTEDMEKLLKLNCRSFCVAKTGRCIRNVPYDKVYYMIPKVSCDIDCRVKSDCAWLCKFHNGTKNEDCEAPCRNNICRPTGVRITNSASRVKMAMANICILYMFVNIFEF